MNASNNIVRISAKQGLIKSVVSQVKAAGDTGILTAINNNLESILSGKLSTADFNTKIAELKAQAVQLLSVCNGTSSALTQFKQSELEHFQYLKGKVDALPTNVYTDTLSSISTAVGQVKTKLDNLNVDLTPITSELNNADHGLSAIKNAISNIPGGGGGGSANIPDSIEDRLRILQGIAIEGGVGAIVSFASIPNRSFFYASRGLNEAKTHHKMYCVLAESLVPTMSVLYASTTASDHNMYSLSGSTYTAVATHSGLDTLHSLLSITDDIEIYMNDTVGARGTSGKTVHGKLDDISDTIGDALDEVTGSAEGFVTNAELAGKVDEVKEAIDSIEDKIGDIETLLSAL